ncbi:TPA: ogr/Delta-like zinc finger family protein [Proteus mirabilis]
MSSETHRSYHQCQNILCGCYFTTITSMEAFLTIPTPARITDRF